MTTPDRDEAGRITTDILALLAERDRERTRAIKAEAQREAAYDLHDCVIAERDEARAEVERLRKALGKVLGLPAAENPILAWDIIRATLLHPKEEG